MIGAAIMVVEHVLAPDVVDRVVQGRGMNRRPVTLFTGQWADLPLEELAGKCGEWGFDGLELACWGDHFDVAAALADPAYVAGQRELLERHGLGCWAIGNHLVGQAVCDPIDAAPRGHAPARGVGRRRSRRACGERAAERMKDTARAAAQLGVEVVTGFTGSPIWHLLYSFPPNDFDEIERGYETFAERWSPIIDVFEAEGVRFALEVHPTEIAYDFLTTRKTLAAIGDRPGLRDQLRPQPPRAPVPRLRRLHRGVRRTIFHAHVKDSKRRLDGRSSILGGHLDFGAPGRGWDFVSPGHGDVDFEAMFRALNRVGYDGPALDRVGGLGDGPRVGRARRARVRAAHRLRAVRRSRSTRRSRASAESPLSGEATGERRWERPTMRPSSHRPSRRRTTRSTGCCWSARAHSRRRERTDPHVVALVVEGGGMRGAVAAGMCLVLEAAGLMSSFDRVYGCSSGALTGLLRGGGPGVGVGHELRGLRRRASSSTRRARCRGGPLLDLDFLFDEVIGRRRPLSDAGPDRGPRAARGRRVGHARGAAGAGRLREHRGPARRRARELLDPGG